ncbi:hypothetical protein P280DRAFT_278046 [Massarina eburnea CBS 473.64]|uniref:Uncharacterized protein n=1 Tax=Massarina eburnea CBS 473.64 TaxID=1395130 RepID=A0A6A6RK47_9PLEO|nr:hypothetical protein P280DRAFT_278046 [Massarina eburnea CBS 473.64]
MKLENGRGAYLYVLRPLERCRGKQTIATIHGDYGVWEMRGEGRNRRHLSSKHKEIGIIRFPGRGDARDQSRDMDNGPLSLQRMDCGRLELQAFLFDKSTEQQAYHHYSVCSGRYGCAIAPSGMSTTSKHESARCESLIWTRSLRTLERRSR